MTSLEESRKTYSVRVTQREDLLPSIKTEPSDGLFIIFSAFDITAYKFPDEDRFYYNPLRQIKDERFIVTPSKILNELNGMFDDANVPSDYHDLIKHQVECITDANSTNARFLILVEIKSMDLLEITDFNYIGSDTISVVIPRFLNGKTRDVLPASKSSIEELERVKVEEMMGTSDDLTCAICLDEFLVKPEVIRMPCSHMYHKNCIFSWLEKSNMCPMCRFEMRVDENLD